MTKLRPNLSITSIHVNSVKSAVTNWFPGWMKNQTKCSKERTHSKESNSQRLKKHTKK